MSTKFQPVAFKVTVHQARWLKDWSERTGLNQAEIVRRALDDYAEAQETRERQRIFTREQRTAIRKISQVTGDSEVQVVHNAINREVKLADRLAQHKKERRKQ